jgi:hypothetical protein
MGGLVIAYGSLSHRFILDLPGNNSRNLSYEDERVFHQSIIPIVTFSAGVVETKKFLPKRPRKIGFYFETSDSNSFIGTERMDPNVIRMLHSHATPDISPDALERQVLLLNSKEFRHGHAEKFEDGDCVAQYEWQTSSFPTCNFLMEQDMTNLELNAEGKESVRVIAHGYWRDVWRMSDSFNTTVLKTMRYEHDYRERNYDRHRRDSMAAERLTGSPYVMDIYGFCGNSGLFEFADGGSIDDSLFYNDGDKWSPSERLVVAFQVITGLSDFHNWDKEGVPAMAHTDITTSQFVYVGETGVYKLNDFNRCRFIRWNQKENKTCTYKVGNNPGTVRVSLSIT